jgi:hypothetical protein
VISTALTTGSLALERHETMPQQRYKTVLRYRLKDQDSPAEDAPNHLPPQVATSNSADEGRGRDDLLQPANLVLSEGAGDAEQGDEGKAGVPQPFDYFEAEEVSEEQVSSQSLQHNSHPLPQFYGFGEIPPDLKKLNSLEYYLLDPDVDPVCL